MRYALLLAALLPGLSCAATADQAKAVDAWFSGFNKTTPGCAVGVEQGGKRILTQAYGMADLEGGRPVTPDTIFEAGSVSKQFTAAAIAVLASRGQLSLDDEVRKYLPDLPDYGAKLTIGHLLHHTSGLRDWSDIVELEGWPRTTRAISEDYAAQAIFRQKALNFTPGAEYLYSNSNYVLLSLIVAKVSGQDFESFTRDNLFLPAGMSHTTWRGAFTRIVPGRAQAYEPDGAGGWKLNMPFENVIGHAGLLTTVGDLLAWNRALSHPPPAFAAWVPMMTEDARLNDGQPVHYALALALTPVNGDKAISHTGSTAGYRAFIGRFPDQDLSLVTLCNGGNTVDNGIQSAKLEAIFSKTAKPQPAAAPKPRPVTQWHPSDQDLAALTGRFQSEEVGGELAAKVVSGALVLESPSGRTLSLRPLTEGKFISQDGQWRIEASPQALVFTSDRSRNIRFVR
ncbi:MAG TPA: serine hydrolase domain-containing protein [Magnetospirillaceae bacterium]|nr:serine hydrolase domain-containing protein [Magnetospirillaceae bacterium]